MIFYKINSPKSNILNFVLELVLKKYYNIELKVNLHISPSCKSPRSSGHEELQGLCGVSLKAVEPRSCASIISPESSSTCNSIGIYIYISFAVSMMHKKW